MKRRVNKRPLLRTKFKLTFKKQVVISILVISLYGIATAAKVVFASSSPAPVLTADTSMPTSLRNIISLLPPDGENMVFPAQNDGVIFHGSRDRKEIALTFDADMTYSMQQELHSGNVESFYDQQIINTLDQTRTKATLFLSGLWIESYPDIAKQLAENELFELANHSYSHPSFSGFCYGLPSMNSDQEDEEIEKTQKLLFDLTKQQNRYFRFPGGCYEQKNIDQLRRKDIVAIQWDSAGVDGFNHDSENIVYNTITNVQNGSIIVLHMNGAPNDPKTAEALPKIIRELKKQGFTFVTVSELLSPNDESAHKPLVSYLSM